LRKGEQEGEKNRRTGFPPFSILLTRGGKKGKGGHSIVIMTSAYNIAIQNVTSEGGRSTRNGPQLCQSNNFRPVKKGEKEKELW